MKPADVPRGGLGLAGLAPDDRLFTATWRAPVASQHWAPVLLRGGQGADTVSAPCPAAMTSVTDAGHLTTASGRTTRGRYVVQVFCSVSKATNRNSDVYRRPSSSVSQVCSGVGSISVTVNVPSGSLRDRRRSALARIVT